MAGTAAERLITEGDERGRVVGVAASADDRIIAIRARKGVVLPTGGFEGEDEGRGKYFPGEPGLMGSPRPNTGDGHRMAEAVGARLARMDQANTYSVTNTVYEGKRHAKPLNEAYKPHGILVNRHGKRFVNEGDPNVGVVLDARDAATGAPIHLPCWRIFDARYAAKNKVAMSLGRRDPHWFRKAGSIARLARQIDLDPAGFAPP